MMSEPQLLSDMECAVTLIGGGKMGSAMLTGWLAAGLDPAFVHIIDPYPSEALQSLAEREKLSLDATLKRLEPGIAVLAVKPQILDVVADAMAPLIDTSGVILSIMAGITLDRLRARFPAAKAIVRAMPNLAASVGCGATIVVPEPGLEAVDQKRIERLLGVSGTAEWLDEEGLMDAGTALSGSGPGYLFYLVECLAEAGERAGLPAEMAARLARQTVAGAGALLAQSPKSATELREEVTSPGGTTQAGLAVLSENGRLSTVFADAVRAAAARSRELTA